MRLFESLKHPKKEGAGSTTNIVLCQQDHSCAKAYTQKLAHTWSIHAPPSLFYRAQGGRGNVARGLTCRQVRAVCRNAAKAGVSTGAGITAGREDCAGSCMS